MTTLVRRGARPSLLARLIEHPDLPQRIRALPGAELADLVRRIGVEDVGELIALASPEQLIGAFDEALFHAAKPGEREAFDARAFTGWLAALLEAGDDAAAATLAELSEDFLLQALTCFLWVFDLDTVWASVEEDPVCGRYAEKRIEGAMAEEFDTYLIVARDPDTWDDFWTLLLAWDRNHRALLERLLERAAALSADVAGDAEALMSALRQDESLAEDVEAEREERRRKLGFVEPREARSFLAWARIEAPGVHPLVREWRRELPPMEASAWLETVPTSSSEEATPFRQACRLLQAQDPALFGRRVQEMALLANVVMAGAEVKGRAFRAAEAAEAVVATLAYGAAEELHGARPSPERLAAVLREHEADRLFVMASRALAARFPDAKPLGLLLRGEVSPKSAAAKKLTCS